MIGFRSIQRPFIIILVILISISGCAQHVKISPRKCVAPKARWALDTDAIHFKFKHHIRTNGSFTLIRKILDRKNRSCADLDTVSLTHKYTWSDVLWNLIPFAGRSTLIVNGSSSASKPQNNEDVEL